MGIFSNYNLQDDEKTSSDWLSQNRRTAFYRPYGRENIACSRINLQSCRSSQLLKSLIKVRRVRQNGSIKNRRNVTQENVSQ